MANNDAQLTIGVDASALTAGMRQAAASVREGAEQMKGHLESVTGVFEKLNVAFVALGAVLAGGAAFKEAVAETVKLGNETFTLQTRLGVTAQAAGELNTALKLIGVGADTYTGAAMHLDRQVRKNEESINALGLKTRDTNGEFKNQQQLVDDAVTLLGEYKEGTDRNLASQALFGRSVEEVTALMMLNNEMRQRAKEDEEELALTVTDKGIAANRHYQVAMNEVGLVMEGVSKSIGDKLMPNLTVLAEWFRSIGPSVISIVSAAFDAFQEIMTTVKEVALALWDVLKTVFSLVGDLVTDIFGAGGEGVTAMEFFVNTMRVVQAAAIVLRVGFEVVFASIKAAIMEVVAVFKLFAAVAKAALTPGASVSAAWKQETKNIEDIVAQSTANLVRIATKGREDIDNAIMGTGKKKENDDSKYDLRMGKGSKSYVEPEKEKKQKKDDSQMGFWEMKLEQAKAYYMQANDLREYSKQQEKDYWQSVLASGAANEKERVAIEKKIATLNLEIWKQSAKEKHAIDELNVTAHEKAAMDEVANDELTARSKLENNQISNEQMLKEEQGFEDRRYEIQKKALEEKMAMAATDPDKNVVLMAQLHAQQEELARQHALRMHEIENKQTKDANKNWLSMTQTMQNGFAQVISGVLKGQMTMAQAIRGLMQTVVGSVIDMLAQTAAKFLANKLMEMVTGKTAAASEISANAGVAATAAMASVAAIPFYGWAMAPAVGAETFGVAMGYQASLAAEGGFDIPAGVNPLVQTHQREMILPAEHADTIRGLAGGGGNSAPINFNVTALDGHSVKKFFDKHGPALADALRGQGRNFNYQGAR